MTIAPSDSTIYRGLLSDEELAPLFSDESELRGLLDVEAALARAEGGLDIIPRDAALRIDSIARRLSPSPSALTVGTAITGVPITALLTELRQAVGDDAQYVHWGATSQDIVDTALVLRLRAACHILESRLARLAIALMGQADRHRRTVMAGRTRFQQAVPTTFGLKVAGWLSMLCRHRDRLREFEGRLFVVQFGGAAGTLAALGPRGMAVTVALARELGLGVPPSPWHTQRDNIAELAGWLSLVSATLGKIARDILLLAQSEIAEVRPSLGGGSSTMPQKTNPISAEVLVTLAQANANHLASMHGAMGQEHERGGSGWMLEWLTLPQMVIATGAGLAQAIALVESLIVDDGRMGKTIEAANGLTMAEAAVFTLCEQMPRSDAEHLVAAACRGVTQGEGHLGEVLKTLTDVALDVAALRDPHNYLGSSEEFINRVLAQAQASFARDDR